MQIKQQQGCDSGRFTRPIGIVIAIALFAVVVYHLIW